MFDKYNWKNLLSFCSLLLMVLWLFYTKYTNEAEGNKVPTAYYHKVHQLDSVVVSALKYSTLLQYRTEGNSLPKSTIVEDTREKRLRSNN